jgi:hypothetical protein
LKNVDDSRGELHTSCTDNDSRPVVPPPSPPPLPPYEGGGAEMVDRP